MVVSSSVYMELSAFHKMLTASGPDFCHARYGMPSGPGADALAMRIARMTSRRFGCDAGALQGGPSGQAAANHPLVLLRGVGLW